MHTSISKLKRMHTLLLMLNRIEIKRTGTESVRRTNQRSTHRFKRQLNERIVIII